MGIIVALGHTAMYTGQAGIEAAKAGWHASQVDHVAGQAQLYHCFCSRIFHSSTWNRSCSGP